MLMAAKLCACMLIGNAFQQQNLLALKLPTSSVQDPQVPLSLQKSMAAVCAYCLWAQASNFQPHCVQASVVATRTVFLQLWISPSSIHPMEEPAYQHTSEMRLLAVIVILYKFYKIHGWRSFHAKLKLLHSWITCMQTHHAHTILGYVLTVFFIYISSVFHCLPS